MREADAGSRILGAVYEDSTVNFADIHRGILRSMAVVLYVNLCADRPNHLADRSFAACCEVDSFVVSLSRVVVVCD
jgi:hypothetical protein